ncbi:hypothetical protein [Kitasatospora brasiliensis]|uniref:hypothetical protein n=1 Tax=Kitasatospora brasiliensis TaxID=3058040 RepID=UPI0029311DFA|nr:hypothetical protein [Kitasatospora sp. K002]
METIMQMNDMYQSAIDGTLKSSGDTGSGQPLTFHNMTSVYLAMYQIATDGTRWGWSEDSQVFSPGQPGQDISGTNRPGFEGGQSVTLSDPCLNWYWLFVNAWSGAFAAVFQTPADGSSDIYITDWDLLEPNDIGTAPTPDNAAGMLIPTDSPRIVVGSGLLGPAGYLTPNVVVREQFWQRLPDSYSIAPGETKQSSYTVTSGRQETTSELSTLEASVNASVSAGWGPVSASVSAALSTSSTNFQQVTVTEQTTSYVSEKYSLDQGAESPEMMLYWQLADVVTIYDWGGSPLGSIVTGTQPTVIGGPYTLPDPAAPTP